MAKFLNKNNKGFTLVEMLVTVTIFSIVISISAGLLVSAIWLQKKGLDHQRLLDQTSYAMEYMSRSLRMAKEDTSGGCIAVNTNYGITRSGEGIKFLNANNGECWEFFREWNSDKNVFQLKIDKNDGNGPYELTSTDLTVNHFNVQVDSSSGQPKVTIFLDIEGKNSHFYSASKIKIQTTVSQRDLNL